MIQYRGEYNMLQSLIVAVIAGVVCLVVGMRLTLEMAVRAIEA